MKRTRQFILFLVAIVLPGAALSVLTYRFLLQGEELEKQREPGRRREAVEQAQRELEERLEKIRLEEINRRVTAMESTGSVRAADAAIVFAMPVKGNELVLPWERRQTRGFPSPLFLANKEAGEVLEFQTRDFQGAAAAYRTAMAEARQAEERCDSRLILARALVKADKPREAKPLYHEILRECGSASDEQGMPFALYAAERLISLRLDIGAAEYYLTRHVQDVRFREPSQTTMIRSLLAAIGSDAANRAYAEAGRQMEDFQQVLDLLKEFHTIVQPLAEKQWVAYGKEPWLLKLTPAPPFGLLLFGVSSRDVAPPGTVLHSTKTAGSYTLSPGFFGVEMELDPSRSFTANSTPVALILGGMCLILVLTILSGYLFLRGVNRELQMAELRSHFVASVSHELKTPLTAIRMFAETLVLGRARDETARSEYLETIVNESERLARLVDNVLDFSKIEQGKKIYRMRLAGLPGVVRSAARAMQYPLSQQGFELKVSVDDHLPPVSADADALEQAILNLLSNALKYSKDSRQIELCCGRKDGHAVIAVTDHGIGISPDDQTRIFEKFYRVRSTDTDSIAGTGLGLTLVKHIAAAHGGLVDVQSVPGEGSTFSIRIPFSSETPA
jgi:signal transduction histidine kinase